VFRSPPAGGSATLPSLRPGQVVGRFELVREIGRGGFGVVYEARDRELGRTVALKAVRTGGDLELKEERLLHEAEAAAQLSHPNIVTLHDLGRFEGRPYLVMELLRGSNLWQRIERGAVAPAEALRIGLEIAKAIAHAHANGVIHRDLTPGNVFLCGDGHVKVLDFGMAQAFGRRKLDGGTRDYMAPEQLRGDPEDERTDVFALGVMLHQLVSGAVPFPNAGAVQGASEAPRLDVPEEPALADLVARMLQKDPARRPRSGGEVLASLATIAEAASRTQARPTGLRRRPDWIRRALVAAAGAAVLAATALGASRSRTASAVERGTGDAGAATAAAASPEGVAPPIRAALPAPPPVPGAERLPSRPAREASVRRASPTRPRTGVRDCRASINAVPTPGVTSGDGVLTVEADPFGDVFVNGRPYGETPRECRVNAGTYAIRTVHPSYGTREARIEVRAGERARWTADYLGSR
jgi:hypothetical protein